jgi:hypothetical protein
MCVCSLSAHFLITLPITIICTLNMHLTSLHASFPITILHTHTYNNSHKWLIVHVFFNLQFHDTFTRHTLFHFTLFPHACTHITTLSSPSFFPYAHFSHTLMPSHLIFTCTCVSFFELSFITDCISSPYLMQKIDGQCANKKDQIKKIEIIQHSITDIIHLFSFVYDHLQKIY